MKYNTKGRKLKNNQETRSATRHGVKQKDIKRTETTKNAKCKAEGIKCVCAQERCHVCTGAVVRISEVKINLGDSNSL